jgi:ABC-2 type transport system ATP-binding protein
MRQRLLIARALLNRPRVLFLDEPSSSLDPWSAGELRELVVGLAADEVAIVLVTHDPGEAAQLCRRVAVLDAGRVTALGAPQDVL